MGIVSRVEELRRPAVPEEGYGEGEDAARIYAIRREEYNQALYDVLQVMSEEEKEKDCKGHRGQVFGLSLIAALLACLVGMLSLHALSAIQPPPSPLGGEALFSLGVLTAVVAIVSLGFMIGAAVASRCDKC